MRQGDKGGWVGEIRKIFREVGMEEELWEEEKKGKGEWKRMVGEALEQWEREQWEGWRKGEGGGAKNNHIGETKVEWGRERYLNWPNKEKIALLASFRIGVAELRGNKTGMGQSAEERAYRCCGGKEETEFHLIMECDGGRIEEEREECKDRIDELRG